MNSRPLVSEVGLLLCLITLQQASIASASHCQDLGYVTGRLEDCYEERCAAIGCSFGCIGDDNVCDSHVGEYSYDDWNDWAMEQRCESRNVCTQGAQVCYDCDTLEWVDCGRIACRANGDEIGEIDERAAAAILGILVVICLVSFIILAGGMYCCIQNKSKTLGSRPSNTAWIASLLICIFVGPLCMWIPFVMDSCYERRTQPTVVVQQMQPQQPMMVMPQQPVIAQAQVQPMMAQAQAQPVMAQAQPTVAQAQPMSKAQQGP